VTRVLNEDDLLEALVGHRAALVPRNIFLGHGGADRSLTVPRGLQTEGAAAHPRALGIPHARQQ
jgi:hypothetical protein